MAEALEVTPAELDAFADRLGEVESYLHLDEKRTHVTELEAKSVAPGFWDDADAARATMEEIARVKEDIAAVDTARGELADARGCRLVALVGVSPESSLEELEHLVCAGADEVLACRDERLRQNDAEVYARLICDLVAERKPEAILYGATAFGRELAPGVAVRLQTGLTADCTVLSMDAETGLLQQTRPAFGGNLMATIVCPNHRPQMATVRPGIFKAPDFDYGRSGTITQVALAEDVKARVEISIPAEEWGQQASIADAERLVVVGRGIGSKKNLPLMRKLAEALGAELGCTRPVVEAGWLEYRHQIGQTGVSGAPKLLVSIGVSGAIQHLAGIGGAECVIAINEDPDAPIFGAAQYKVVGDAVEVVEELLAQLER